jgi:hypothetical protein
MSGNGNHNTPLGNKIKSEVLSALRLLFKNLDSHSVDTRFAVSFTVYLTKIPCLNIVVNFQYPFPTISEDPIKTLSKRQIQQTALPLKPVVQLAETEETIFPEPVIHTCEWEPVLSYEPVLTDSVLTVQAYPIEQYSLNPDKITEIETCLTTTQAHQPWSSGKIGTLKTTCHTQNLKSIKTIKSLSSSRFHVLPIQKIPLSPQRFSLDIREQFRQALAEKHQTVPGNIQLKQIFQSMHMSFYSSIQTDESGSLLCIPKTGILSTTSGTYSDKTEEAAWLIIGIRLDTKEIIRTLMPNSALKISPTLPSPTKGGGDNNIIPKNKTQESP